MSTFLIETSEEDATTAVARLVGEYLNDGKEKTALAETPGSQFVTTCTGLVAENRSAELLELFLKHTDLIFEKASGKDLECILLVICNLLPKLPVEQQKVAAMKASSALTASSEKDKKACLMALVELYNVAFDSSARFAVLIQIIKYARSSGLQGEVGPVVRGKAGEWVKEWGLGKEDARQLYIEVAALLKSLQSKAGDAESFELRMKCLASYEDSDPAELAAAREVAAETAADFVQNQEMFKCDLFGLAAFKQLEASPGHVAVFQLLSIMLKGNLKGLQAFAKDYASCLTACNITLEDAMLKTRLMALLALGSRGGAVSTVTFEQIRDALSIPEDEVEQWVVTAIGKKLVEAKIDQPQRSVQFTRCTQREFDVAQWEQLHSQLQTWRDNLTSVSEMVSTAAR
mmetsp:Transcript_16892/g.47145  ORF Transcript_16892/g.47145 Transcript_16892/m.47145 type:complete len:403 (-) Transcript_16892:152-1360(-)